MENLNINSYIEKKNQDPVSHEEWNGVFGAIQTKVNELVENVNEGGTSGGSSEGGSTHLDSHVYMTSKHNLEITTTENDVVNGKGGKINVEPYSDLQVKPGDDVSLYSHHRTNTEEVSLKILNGAEVSSVDNAEIEEYPVDLQLNAANVVLTTKDKDIYISEKNKARTAEGKDNTQDKSNVLNFEIKTGVKSNKATASKGQYGYFKLRAQAIDLRCEDHGGISLQPKGYDSDGNMNKIKFEHGGGDGLEFGTFNVEKSSLFTDEYRFKKNGIIKLATRITKASGKTDDGVFDNTPSGKTATNALKYVKQEDDFYDIIDSNDPQCTWEDIVKFIFWAKSHNQGPWESQLSTPIITLAQSTYRAYVGEIDKIVATISPSNLQSSLKYVSENASKLDLSNDGYIEPTTVGNYYVNVVFEGNSQYERVSVRVLVIVMAAREEVSLTITPESGQWSASNNLFNNNVMIMEVAPSETIENAIYHWSTYPAGILNFTPISGHPDGDSVAMTLVDPTYTGTFNIFVEYDGNDTILPADTSHAYTITA